MSLSRLPAPVRNKVPMIGHVSSFRSTPGPSGGQKVTGGRNDRGSDPPAEAPPRGSEGLPGSVCVAGPLCSHSPEGCRKNTVAPFG